MQTKTDQKYMQMCLELAQKARGNTYPNPMVGCVIVYNDVIIGSGYHTKAGEPHAEVFAIQSVEDKTLLPVSTLYVNLEPCAHHGKTPPCADLIISYKIKRVVIGCKDSFKEVAGKGIKKLQEAGVDVCVGVLEKESIQLNARFFTFHEKNRPYIILKWAQTQDGFIDQAPELKGQTKGLWITDNFCKKLVHQWRTEEQAILVGTNTAEVDNPQLTARLVKGNQPLRLAIDLQNRLPENLYLKDSSTPTVIYTLQLVKNKNNLEFIKIVNQETMWNEIFADLNSRKIQSVIIEGGAQVLQDCIDKNLWDEMRVFTGPTYFIKGIKGPEILIKPHKTESKGNSVLDFYYNGVIS